MGESSHLKHTCFHCGNTGLLIVKYKGSEAFGGLYPDGDYDLRQNYTWYLLSCPVCRMLTLYQAYSDESMQVPTEDGWEIIEDYSTLYPQCSIDYDGVPREIKSAFEAALKVKNLDHSICLMALRRVLEAV